MVIAMKTSTLWSITIKSANMLQLADSQMAAHDNYVLTQAIFQCQEMNIEKLNQMHSTHFRDEKIKEIYNFKFNGFLILCE
jgi:hypothetical protein